MLKLANTYSEVSPVPGGYDVIQVFVGKSTLSHSEGSWVARFKYEEDAKQFITLGNERIT